VGKRLWLLEDHNDTVVDHVRVPVPNGIACRKCGAEMMDAGTVYQDGRNPPSVNIFCPACGLVGLSRYKVPGVGADGGEPPLPTPPVIEVTNGGK
jgi:hypothetical protein